MIFRIALAIIHLLTNHPLLASEGIDYQYYEIPGAQSLGQGDVGKMYHFFSDGNHYVIKLHEVMPYKPNPDGQIRNFVIVDNLGPAPTDEVGKNLQMSEYTPSPDVPVTDGVSGGSGNGNGAQGQGGQGTAGDGYGFGAGVADTIGIGTMVYGAGTSYTVGYSVSTGIATQLRDNFVNNLKNNSIYANRLGEAAQAIRDSSGAIDAATSTMIGDILAELDEIVLEDPVAEEMLAERLKPADCDVPATDGGFMQMPRDFQSAYLAGDLARVSEYVGLLSTPGSISGFCVGQLSGISTGSGVLSINQMEPNLPRSPLEDTKFNTDIESSEGALVRELANKYQVQWSNSFGMQNASPGEKVAYDAGLALLKSADNQLAKGDFASGGAQAEASEIMLNVASGVSDGVSEAVDELVEAAPVLGKAISDFVVEGYQNPNTIIEKSQAIYNAIPEVVDGIKQDIIKDYDTIMNGSAYERSKLIGRIAVDRAVDFVTGGTTKILKASGKVVSKTVQTAAQKAAAKRMRQSMGDTAYDQSIRGRILEKSDALDTKGIGKKAQRISDATDGLDLSEDAQDYLANQVLNEQKIAGKSFDKAEINRMAKKYIGMEKAIKKLPKSKFSGQMHRGIPKQFGKGDVFKSNYHSYVQNHRFSTVGDTGLYGAVGDYDKAVKTILAETGMSIDDLVFDTRKVTSDRILDLSSSKAGLKNLKDLGLNIEEVTARSYRVTHALGDLARKNGYQGVLFNSTHKTGRNLVLF